MAELGFGTGLLKGVAVIAGDSQFDDCMILSKDAFDPDAVFLDDIVDDQVLPNPTLAVDGLTERADAKHGQLELQPGDVANDDAAPDTVFPEASLDVASELEVYGWESSLWRKLKGYFGF